MGRFDWDSDRGSAIIASYDHIGRSVYVRSAVWEDYLSIVEDLVYLESRQAVCGKFLFIVIIE